jgi:hypothetical protein
VKAEADRVEKVNELMRTIADVFSFAGAVDKLPKIEAYQNAIDKLWKQAFECGLFIQEYAGRGFARKCPNYRCLPSMSN